jgi:hypothetical protein
VVFMFDLTPSHWRARRTSLSQATRGFGRRQGRIVREEGIAGKYAHLSRRWLIVEGGFHQLLQAVEGRFGTSVLFHEPKMIFIFIYVWARSIVRAR